MGADLDLSAYTPTAWGTPMGKRRQIQKYRIKSEREDLFRMTKETAAISLCGQTPQVSSHPGSCDRRPSLLCHGRPSGVWLHTPAFSTERREIRQPSLFQVNPILFLVIDH